MAKDIPFKKGDHVEAIREGQNGGRVMKLGERGVVVKVEGYNVTLISDVDGATLNRTPNYLIIIERKEETYQIY